MHQHKTDNNRGTLICAILFSNDNEQTTATAITWMKYDQKHLDEFTGKREIGPYSQGTYQMHHITFLTLLL